MRKIARKAMAFALALAMVLSVSGISDLSATASAASAKKLKLSATKVTLKVGSSKTVTVKNKPKKSTVTWSTKNKKIAKVSSKGKITGVKKGTTTITCKVTYKAKVKGKTKKYTKKLTVKVTVKAAASAAVPTVAPTVAPTTAPSAAPTAAPTLAPTEEPSPTPFNVKSDDTSNIGTVSKLTVNGGTEEITKKDNGTMRKDLSSQYLINNEMGMGINLGNTMEATKAIGELSKYTEATDYEQAWGAPITTQAYIDSIHSYGINTLRVPVAWSSLMKKDDDGNYVLSPKMLGRVEEIVNYALNNGMYVIINEHYDYGWWGAFGTCVKDDNGNIVADEDARKDALKRYTQYWEQITARFKDYSDHLIFESANEEFGTGVNEGNLGFNTAVDGITGNLTEDECYELTNKLNQVFVDTVRKSGGNNAYRHLLIAGFATNFGKTEDARYVMPTDTSENGNTKLSVSVHYYDPWSFCGDDAEGKYTDTETANTEKAFGTLSKFTDAGYGVIIGECGVCNPRQDNVTKCLEDVIRIAKEHGCLPVLWDTPGTYFDRKNCILNYKDVAELFNRLNGANGDTNIAQSTGAPDKSIFAATIPDGATPVWEWNGLWKKNDGKNIGIDGDKVTSVTTDEERKQFVRTTDCTDLSLISFNDWGYNTKLNFNWSSMKKPVIELTFKEDTTQDPKGSIGGLQLATIKEITDNVSNNIKYKYENWNTEASTNSWTKNFIVPAAIIQSSKTKPWTQVTFDNAPVVTSIKVYDLGE